MKWRNAKGEVMFGRCFFKKFLILRYSFSLKWFGKLHYFWKYSFTSYSYSFPHSVQPTNPANRARAVVNSSVVEASRFSGKRGLSCPILTIQISEWTNGNLLSRSWTKATHNDTLPKLDDDLMKSISTFFPLLGAACGWSCSSTTDTVVKRLLKLLTTRIELFGALWHLSPIARWSSSLNFDTTRVEGKRTNLLSPSTGTK